MDEKEYYALLGEYQELISQKKLNEHLCNRQELDDIKASLCKAIKIAITYTTADMIKAEKNGVRNGTTYVAKQKCMVAEMKRNVLIQLLNNISNEQQIDIGEYEGTYRETRFHVLLSNYLLVLGIMMIVFAAFLSIVVLT